MSKHLSIASIAASVTRKPRKRRDGNAEARIQAAICAWARTVAPDCIIAAIPNGGLRSKSEAARMKWTGTLSGMPDLIVMAPDARAFFIECKAVRGGRFSPEQEDIIFRLRCMGFFVAICRSIDDARAAFEVWKITTREILA